MSTERSASGPFLMGDELTIADPYLFVITGWADKMIGLADWPSLSAFRKRMLERPSVRHVLRFEGLLEEQPRGPLERPRRMSQFDLTDDQLQIQEMARKFTADAITPFAAEWDEKHIFPRDTIREAAELGFGSIYV